jgi:hypothetical protein
VRERGYPGRPDHFRHLIARIRPKTPAEAYLKLRTLPGEHYGESPVMVSPEKAPRGGAMFFRASFA